MQNINQRLKELREKAGLSGLQLGKKLNISSSFVSDIEHGKRKVSYKYLLRVCEVLKVPLEIEQELTAMLRCNIKATTNH